MEGIAAILKADLHTTEQVEQLREEYTADREENRIRWQKLTDLLQEVSLKL